MPVMTLHFYLFRYAKGGPLACSPTVHAHDDEPEEAARPIFNLANPGRSLASKIFHKLTALLVPRANGHREGWSVMYSILGDEWPREFLEMVRKTLLLVMGNLWRRFIFFFRRWPWKLVIVLDESVPMEKRLEVANLFFEVSLCCLDAGLGKRLRAMLSGPQDLFMPAVQEFLTNFFLRAVLSTAFIECLFAAYRQWLHKSYKPLKITTVGAKHVPHRFQQALHAKRRAREKPQGVSQKTRRTRCM